MLYFLKIGKATADIIIFHLCTKNRDDMIYSSWDIESNRLKLVIMSHFSALLHPPPLSLLPLTKQSPQKKQRNYRRYHHFKPQPYEVGLLRYGVRQTEFFVILGHFFRFYLPLASRDMECHRQFFVILGHFLLFYHTNNPKNWKLEKKILSFYTCVP